MPYAMFLFICLVWSVSFILMKKAALAFSPVEIGLWRVVAGAATLVLLWGWRDRAWSLRRGDFWPLAFVVAAGFAWPYCLQPWVIRREGSAFMALMVSFVPLLTIMISLGVLKIAPSTRQLLGVIGSLVCMAVLMADGLRRNVPVGDVALAFTVPLCYATTNIVIRQRLAHVGSLLLTLVCLAASAAVLAPATAWSASPTAKSAAEASSATLALAFLGIVGTGFTTFVFNKLIREHGPLFAGMTTNLVPLGAVLCGWLDAEDITLLQVAALMGIIAMVTLVQYRAATPVKPPSDPSEALPVAGEARPEIETSSSGPTQASSASPLGSSSVPGIL